MGRTLYMETTKIAAEKTAAELSAILAQAGASAVMIEYGSDRTAAGLSFVIAVEGVQRLPFKLPVNVEPIFRLLNGRRKTWGKGKRADMVTVDREQATRVAWRQVYRWVQAQLALIDTGMVKTQEVFLPYIRDGDGGTFYQRLEKSGFKQLTFVEES